MGGRSGRVVAGAALGGGSPLATIAPRIAAVPGVAPGRFGIMLPGDHRDGDGATGGGADRRRFSGGRQAALPARPERFGGQAGAGEAGPGANPGAYKPALDYIAQREGTANRPGGGYDTSLDYGRWMPGGQEQQLTGKTLDEVDQLQTGMLQNPQNRARYGNGQGSSALGRYQIVRKTLRGLRQKLGLRGDEKFDAAMQDRLGAELARQRGADPRGLGQEWASLRGQHAERAAELMRQVPRDASTASTGAREPAGAPQDGANGQFDPLGGAARRYSSGFGMREHPVHGGQKMHWGQDMAAPAGTAVNSMQAGRISQISLSGDVTVTHAVCSTKTYRHIAPGGIREGQNVEVGGPLGRLRAHDPRSTGPHLHLEATDAQGKRYDPRAEIEAARRLGGVAVPRREAESAGGGLRQITPWTAHQNREVPQPADLAPERRLPEAGDPQAPSPRFAEPRQLEARRRPEMDGPGQRSGGGGPGAASGPVTQNFHGGFDAGEVARRSTLERNREIRRSQAGALHDIGRIA